MDLLLDRAYVVGKLGSPSELTVTHSAATVTHYAPGLVHGVGLPRQLNAIMSAIHVDSQCREQGGARILPCRWIWHFVSR